MGHSFSMLLAAARMLRFMSVEPLLPYGPREKLAPRSDLVGRHNKPMHPSINILRRRATSSQLLLGCTPGLVHAGPALRKTGPVAPRTAGNSILACAKMEANSKHILWTIVAP